MKKLSTTIAAAVIGVALVAATAGARSQATAVRLSTTLTPSQETPAPKGDVTNATGTFTGTLTKSTNGGTLTFRLTFSGLTGRAIAAHIHVAAPGQSGPIAVPLCAPCESPVTGTANVNATTIAAIQSNRAYVNVHTPTNGTGEIRGQLSITASTRSTLTSGQAVGRLKGNVRRARGTFTATFRRSGSRTVMSWRLTFGHLTGRAIAAHVHFGKRGKTGGIAVPLCAPCRSNARGTKTVKGRALAAIESGRAYVNVHTPRNPGGEIRGQLRPVALRLSS